MNGAWVDHLIIISEEHVDAAEVGGGAECRDYRRVWTEHRSDHMIIIWEEHVDAVEVPSAEKISFSGNFWAPWSSPNNPPLTTFVSGMDSDKFLRVFEALIAVFKILYEFFRWEDIFV